MLLPFLKKQKKIENQKKLITAMIVSLNISPDQKRLYSEALNILTPQQAEELFRKLTRFVEKIELKDIEQIQKESFQNIAGMRKRSSWKNARNEFSLIFIS